MPCFLYVRETYVFLAFLVLSIPNPCNGLHTRSTIAALFQLPEDFFRCQLSALPHVLFYHANVRSSKLHVKELGKVGLHAKLILHAYQREKIQPLQLINRVVPTDQYILRLKGLVPCRIVANDILARCEKVPHSRGHLMKSISVVPQLP